MEPASSKSAQRFGTKKGRIMLQDHGGKVWFREIEDPRAMIFENPLLLFLFLGSYLHARGDTQMGVKPGLKFDLPGFHVLPGERVKLTFTNNDEMMHNIVFTNPGKRIRVVEAAIALGAQGLEKQFVPEIPAVLAYTPIVMPGQKFVLG